MNSAAIDRTAGMTRYAVSLQFTDGQYNVDAWGYSREQAIGLAVIDARMMKPSSGNRDGKLLSSEAVPAPVARAA